MLLFIIIITMLPYYAFMIFRYCFIILRRHYCLLFRQMLMFAISYFVRYYESYMPYYYFHVHYYHYYYYFHVQTLLRYYIETRGMAAMPLLLFRHYFILCHAAATLSIHP